MTDRIDALLDDAIAAVRQHADDGVTDGAATRLRLRESLARRHAPRKIVTIIAAVIAMLFGSTAFAYYVGGWRPSFVERETPETPVVVVSEPAAAVEPVMPARTVRREAAPVLAPIVVDPPKQRVAVEPVLAPLPPAPVPELPPAPVTTPDPELAAYRLAHEAHFRGGDPNVALAAWDDYLAKFPAGRLAVEARYDRALVLIKLRRFADARAALQPFAEGTYRRAEAIKLLSAIQNR